ncbi:hypothetical protein FDP41_000535 [Naegleria fowleri]|uniref:Homologous-pairing protein 2 homolog n=1 Tax=Naegleria fowleri TaxID=5763 RepID=A0A6A5CA57_NAEFO|nr:uncharacterized protein FDP41_000535 [Naegleria fowleri]KAF0984636.1 hypothetical protein FDP41_000535 [Naegleria fowleri]CAG4718470.1 unnamed protein product [Naegleria fowleri]
MAPKRKRTIEDEEEEYQPEDAVEVIGSDDDDEDEFMENVVDDDDDDTEFKEKAPKKKKKDEDEDEEETDGKKKKKSSKKSSTKEKKETKKKASSSDKDSKKKASGGKKGSTSSGPKKKDLTIKDESEARKVVLDLFKKANRPFNLQNVIDQSKGQLKKAMATKCVDKLESKGELSVKVNGKTKIWWINQDNLEVLSKEELKEIDNEIKELQQELAGIRSEIAQDNNTKAKLLKAPTTDELPNIIMKERAELEQKKKKLESLQSGSIKLCTIEEKKEALKHLEKYLKEWKSRKRLTMNIVDTICELTEKTRSAFIEESGIDTDEMVGQNIDEIGKLH